MSFLAAIGQELAALTTSDGLQEHLEQAVLLCINALESGHKLLACGNGGSAAQASHFVAELVGRYGDRWQWLPAIALNADGPVLTALANDSQYTNVFAHQVRALGEAYDMLLCLSTSGQSLNIRHALDEARGAGMRTILLTGQKGHDMERGVDVCLCVPSTDTQRIQEMHLILLHALAAGIQEGMAT